MSRTHTHTYRTYTYACTRVLHISFPEDICRHIMSLTHLLDTESICPDWECPPVHFQTSCHDKKKFHSTQTNTKYTQHGEKGIKCSFNNLMLLTNWYIPMYRYFYAIGTDCWQHEPAVLLLSYASGFPVFLLSLTSKVLHSKTIGLLSNLLRIVLPFAELFISGILSHGLFKGDIFP